MNDNLFVGRRNELAILEAGYKFLMERAEKITNPEWKKSYLENFPEHREIVAKWQALQKF
jgi:hypothetical protein